jgi:hypothetical protein
LTLARIVSDLSVCCDHLRRFTSVLAAWTTSGGPRRPIYRLDDARMAKHLEGRRRSSRAHRRQRARARTNDLRCSSAHVISIAVTANGPNAESDVMPRPATPQGELPCPFRSRQRQRAEVGVMNRLLARAALEAGFRHLPFGRYASAAAFEMTLRPQFFRRWLAEWTARTRRVPIGVLLHALTNPVLLQLAQDLRHARPGPIFWSITLGQYTVA